jgi:hypothetical protein
VDWLAVDDRKDGRSNYKYGRHWGYAFASGR